MNKIRSPKHYREWAEECRTLAEYLDKEELRIRMLGVAKDYEHMAEAIENMLEQRREP